MTEPREADAALRHSEERYRTLFESIDEGFCIIEVLFDAGGHAIDYRFLETNPAFASQTGLRDVVGKRVRELEPRHEEHWFETYGRVALTGRPARFTNVAQHLDSRWYDVYAFPIGPRHEHQVAVLFNDVTARKQAHDNLRMSEERLRLASEAASLLTWEIDITTGASVVGSNYAEVFGWTEAHRPSDAMAAITALVHPDDAPGLIAAMQKTARGEGDLRYEHRVVHPISKQVSWTETYGTLVEGGEDGHVRVVGVARNVTARRRAYASIKASADRDAYRVRLSDALRPLVDPQRIQAEAMHVLRLHLNAARAHYIVVEGEEGVVHMDDTNGIAPVVGRHRLRDYGAGVLTLTSRGEPFIVNDVEAREFSAEQLAKYSAISIGSFVIVPLIKGGQFSAAVGVSRETPHEWTADELAMIQETAERTWAALEQARAEAARRESDERRRLALDAAAMGSFIWHPKQDRSEVDTQLLALVGLAPDTTVNLAQLIATLVHPDDRDRFAAAVERSVDPSGTGELNDEIRVIRPDGTEHWLAVTGRVAFTGHPPQALRMVGVATEITERKQNEARLREADQRKDEFLAMLAHELRNPLAPIRTGLELIRLAGDTPGAVERIRGMMQRQVAHMVRLIDDLLDVSRMTSGKIRLQREPTPLDKLVSNAVEANRAAIAARSLELSIELPEMPCVLDVDPTRFVQVLSNLLHNAVKFTEPNGQIRVSARVTGVDAAGTRQLVLSVIDSGIGMSAELLPRIFDLFTQENRESSQSGLGIGLALARRLVDMHGGHIDARSDGPGRGSEFVIRLPLSAAKEESGTPGTIDMASGAMIARRVLVIDDNEDAANATALLVQALGGESRAAYSGDEGIGEAASYRPDVVLLDIGMPGLDGYETCRRLRDTLGSDVFLVALTGFGREQDKEQATRAGFDAHLTKPADAGALTTLLARARSARPAMCDAQEM